MKIGVFDSGLGGLIVTHGFISQLPEYDYVYFGDTARVPYGNRSQEVIYEFTREAIEFLFKKDCKLVIVACNTASAEALRRIQQEFLPQQFPDRKVLGVLIPAAEDAVAQTKSNRIGVLATQSTVSSEAFAREVKKLSPQSEVFQKPAPLLVPLVENNAMKWAKPILEDYLKPLHGERIDTLILGCTHYPFLKELIREVVGNDVKVISQDEVVPAKLKAYLTRHPEIDSLLTKESGREFLVTDLTENIQALANKLFGGSVNLELVHLS